MYYKFSIIVLTIICLVGCSTNSNITNLNSDIQLKIGYLSVDMFTDRYSNLVNQKFPSLNYSVVSLYEMIDQGTDNQQIAASTDIIFVPAEMMSDFINEGLLMNLDSLITKNKLDLSKFQPEIIEYAKNLGEGKLYGIPTSIYGSVLVYNKDIFDANQIDYPRDGMTWEEVLNLAQIFPENGLVSSQLLPSEIIYEVGRVRGLQAYNPDFGTVNIANEQWEEVWDLVITPLRSGALSFQKQLFFNNEVAMAILDSSDSVLIEEHSNWDTITMPIDPLEPANTIYTYTNGFYALSAKTQLVNESFELLQFFLSPQILQLEKANRQHSITIYKNDTPLKTERSMLKLKPVSVYPEGLPFEFISIGEATIKELLSSNLSIEDALATMQVTIEQKLLENQLQDNIEEVVTGARP